MSESTKRRRLSDVSIDEVSLVKKGAVPGSDFVILTKEDTSGSELEQAIEILKGIDDLQLDAVKPIAELLKERVGIRIWHSDWDEDAEPEIDVNLSTDQSKFSERLASLASAVEAVTSAMKVEKEAREAFEEKIAKAVSGESQDDPEEPTDGPIAKEDETQEPEPEEESILAKANRIFEENQKLAKEKAEANRLQTLLANTKQAHEGLNSRLADLNSNLARALGQDA